MTFAAFDTLEFVETLKESGLPEKQAKAISVAVRKSHETADLATKADLREYESAIRSDLEKLEMRMDAKLDKLGAELHHEIGDLRKDIITMEERFNARFDKLWLQLVISLSGVVVVALGVFASFPKVFGH